MESPLGFEDWYRLRVHAVITRWARVLLLKATSGEKAWGFPGGATLCQVQRLALRTSPMKINAFKHALSLNGRERRHWEVAVIGVL